jgi:hypothetical protein
MARIVCHKGNKRENCECVVCFRHVAKLPPDKTEEEERKEMVQQILDGQVRKAKTKAKRDVKAGKQKTLKTFFKSSKPGANK